MNLKLIDRNQDGSFGSFYGHPEGNEASKEMVCRLLSEFDLNIKFFENLVLSINLPSNITHITNFQGSFKEKFSNHSWIDQPYYPESKYQADYGLRVDDRWIFVEIELSDIRRAVNAFFMGRVFRTGFMRLGIVYCS